MQQQSISYNDDKDELIGQLFFDETKGDKQPAVILFPAFEGLSEFALNYAEKITAAGYACFAADMYGNARTANTIEGCFELIGPFLQSRALVRRRVKLAWDVVTKLKQIDTTKMGTIGFCFGGMCVLELARSGAPLKAGVGVHAILAQSDLPTHNMQASLLLLQGYQDPQVPALAALQAFAEEMNAINHHDWECDFYGNAKHSFTDIKTGTFNPEKEAEMGREYNSVAANRAYRRTIDFFDERLK
jgi:dienelactone hydrolase